MKKIMTMLIFVIGLTSTKISAQNYKDTIFADTVYVGLTQAQLSFKSITQDAKFTGAGDSISIIFELIDITLSKPISNYNVTHIKSAGDSIIIATCILPNLTSNHSFKVIPHAKLYQSGVLVSFSVGNTLEFSTDCTPLSAKIIGDTLICNGSIATLTARDTSTSYLWSTGQTTKVVTVNPTITTAYAVTVSNGTCSAIGYFIVKVSTGVNSTISASTTICYGSSAQLIATGGNTYLWNNGVQTALNTVSPTSTRIYSVTISNGSCVNVKSVTVNVGPPMNLMTSADDAMCANEYVPLTATGNATSYFWAPGSSLSNPKSSSPIANPKVTTTYVVTASNSFCAETKSITITVSPAPIVQSADYKDNILTLKGSKFGSINNVEIHPQNIILYPFFNTDSVANFDVIINNFSPKSGDIVIITTETGCKTSWSYSATGIEEDFIKGKIKIFPNPVYDVLNIELPNENYWISLMNISGQEINSYKTKGSFKLSRDSSISAGIYFLKINNYKNQSLTFKVKFD